MQSIKESAMAYEPKHTKNIAELDKIDVNMNLDDRDGKDKDDIPFKYKVALVEGEEYRIPGVVLGDLKSILEKKPDLKFFSVTRKGEGKATRYTVIPME